MQTDGESGVLSIAVIDRTGFVTEVPLAADAGVFSMR